MLTGLEKAAQVGRRDRRRAIVGQRMEVERIDLEHTPVEDHRDSGAAIVDRGERGDCSGLHPEDFHEGLGARERESLAGTELPPKSFQIDPPVLERDDEPELLVLVFQEQALAVTAGEIAAESPALFHGEHRRVVVGAGLDAEIRKMIQELLRRHEQNLIMS